MQVWLDPHFVERLQYFDIGLRDRMDKRSIGQPAKQLLLGYFKLFQSLDLNIERELRPNPA